VFVRSPVHPHDVAERIDRKRVRRDRTRTINRCKYMVLQKKSVVSAGVVVLSDVRIGRAREVASDGRARPRDINRDEGVTLRSRCDPEGTRQARAERPTMAFAFDSPCLRVRRPPPL
jgi:hypothetical protein